MQFRPRGLRLGDLPRVYAAYPRVYAQGGRRPSRAGPRRTYGAQLVHELALELWPFPPQLSDDPGATPQKKIIFLFLNLFFWNSFTQVKPEEC